MKINTKERLILKVVKEKSGLNIYQIRKKVSEILGGNISYTTIHKYVGLLEAKNLIRTELVPIKVVKKVYIKND